MINNNVRIEGLSIITSCGCNLNCSYCRIAQSANKKTAQLQKNTIQALEDGTFLANINKVLNRLNQSTTQISNLAFWGQEPTLTLHHITNHLEDWFTYFPHWTELMFSTNTIAHMDKIYDFILALDKHCKEPCFNFHLQFSYDGDYGTNNLRKGSSSTIHDNITWLLTQLNNTSLNKVRIFINHHGVLSLDLLSKLQTPEEIINYSNHMAEWAHEFNKLNHNKNVHLDNEVDIALENPVQASSLQGLQLHNFCTIAERLNPKKLHNIQQNLGSINPVDSLYKGAWTPFHLLDIVLHRLNFDNLDQALETITINPIIRDQFFREVNHILYCGNGVGELKIMYDGTLVNCQNHIFETEAEFINDTDKMIESTKKSLAKHNYFINGITASDQEWEKYLNFFDTVKHYSFEFIFQSVVILMKFLSITNQIDNTYRDNYKLIKHSLLIAILNCCSYNNQMMTGSIFMRHTGHLRFIANGYLDHVIRDYNEHEGRVVL